jgi:hypothetical protein
VAKRWSPFALALWFCGPAGSFVETAVAQESPSTTDTPKQDATPEAGTAASKEPAAPRPARLTIDIERHIAEAMARDPSLALPRFKEDIEVRDAYQDALDALVRGVDLECGPSGQGPPTRYEMNPYRGATIPVHADFLAPAKLIVKGLDHLFGSKAPHYFLYAVHRSSVADAPGTDDASPMTSAPSSSGPRPSAPSAPEYIVREAPISENARSSIAGVSWELVASFRDRDSALAALRRLRGGSTLQRAHEDGRLPPWVSTTCRPPRIR